VNFQAGEDHGDDELNSVAAMAESFQPKGYTLSSTTVRGPRLHSQKVLVDSQVQILLFLSGCYKSATITEAYPPRVPAHWAGLARNNV